MVIRDGKTGDIKTIDSREKSPAAMVPSSFFIDGKPPTDAQFPINRYSGLSAGVPGTPYAWSYLLRHYGTYELKEALAYGVKVARRRLHRRQDVLRPDHAQRALLRRHPVDRGDLPRRRRHVEGRRHRPPQPGHGQDLRADRPRSACPRASTAARSPTRSSRPTHHRPRRRRRRSLLAARPDDQPRPRALRDQGPRARRARLLRPQALRHGPAVVRRHDRVRDAEHHAGLQPPRRSPTRAARARSTTTSRRRGWPTPTATRTSATRRSSRNPIAGLLSNEYAATRAALIGPTAPPGPGRRGHPARRGRRRRQQRRRVDRVGSTTHLSVADKDGNIVAYTFTIEQTGGNGVVVPGYGFLLNNELTDFDIGLGDRAEPRRGQQAPALLDRPDDRDQGRQAVAHDRLAGRRLDHHHRPADARNRINLHMPLEVALGRPRASQRNSATTEAESAFVELARGPGPAAATTGRALPRARR